MRGNCILSHKLIASIHGWFFTVQLCCSCAPLHPRCKVETRCSTPAAVMVYAACRVQTRLGTASPLYNSEMLYCHQTSLHGEVLGPTFCASADIFERKQRSTSLCAKRVPRVSRTRCVCSVTFTAAAHRSYRLHGAFALRST
jgi:hypothetical protein